MLDPHDEPDDLHAALALLRGTSTLPSDGAPAEALKLGDLRTPLADILRAGGWQVRHSLILMEADRLRLAAGATQPLRRERERLAGTKSGIVRMRALAGGRRSSIALSITKDVLHSEDRLMMKGLLLPASVLLGCEGRMAGDVMELDHLPALAAAVIRKTSQTERMTMLHLELERSQIGIHDIMDA